MYTPTQKREIFKKLSTKTREIVVSTELSSFVYKIVKPFQISHNKEIEIANYVTDVLMEIITKNDFLKELERVFGKENSPKLFNDFNVKIFDNLDGIYSEILKGRSGEEFSEETVGQDIGSKQSIISVKKETSSGFLNRIKGGKGFTEGQLKAKYDSLPLDLKEALDSTEIFDKFQNISDKYRLLIDKAGMLEEEVSYVLLGLLPASKFSDRIREKLGISSEEAQKITGDVNETIFKGFRDSLMKIHSENAVEKREETTPDISEKAEIVAPSAPVVEHAPVIHKEMPHEEIKDSKPAPFYQNMIEKEVPEKDMDRNNILEEIERIDRESSNPVSVPEPIKTIIPQPPAPLKVPEINLPTGNAEDMARDWGNIPNVLPAQDKKTIADIKLSQTMKLGAEKIDATRAGTDKSRPDRSGGVDPYREPIEL